MKVSRRAAAVLSACAVVPVLTALIAVPTAVADQDGSGPTRFTATPIEVTGRLTTPKALSSRVAKPDKTLLARTDAAKVPVVVKLDVDSVAAYRGGVSGLPATSPSVTGRKLTGATSEQRYRQYLARQEASFLKRVRAAVPGVKVGRSLRTVYGGVALQIPAGKAKSLQALPGVVAVQRDVLHQPLTDSSAEFVGAPTLYGELGTTADAGKGLILGNLDSGVWPEHPSLSDQGNLPAPPGPVRTCDFGDNPLTPEADPFQCQNKLIGGAAFMRGYDEQIGDDPYAGTARDSDGHGTHTATTSAGNVLDSASVVGTVLPDVHGIAPGAHVMEYKVCGPQGCLTSDSAAAVGQAILDGVDAINFSISGGADPYTDAAELAFLDAYAAGVFVAASAGNAGPSAGTVNHLSPWVTTVAASTQRREFFDLLTLSAPDGATFGAVGTSLTPGVGPAPVVLGSAAPYSRATCDTPAAPGALSGKIVACQRGGPARIVQGYNVSRGGAVGMIVFNPTPGDARPLNHWLPTTELADGAPFAAFMAAHSGVTGSFDNSDRVLGRGDVMARFSSRGPRGTTIKPDLTAPGVDVLAGHTPTPSSVADGPPGEYFQAINGTSMASPHVAGAALLVKAVHPTWTPGQIRSALMTTATTAVVKEDSTTPADPFDLGAGRIDLTKAGAAALTFEETAANMALLGGSADDAVNLNLPSVNAPTVPGTLTITRTARNVSGRAVTVAARASSPAGTKVVVKPRRAKVRAGGTLALRITVDTTKASAAQTGAQQFGRIDLSPDAGPALHLPVAFVPRQGVITLASTCAPASIPVGQETTCTVTAQNTTGTDTSVSLTSAAAKGVEITEADDATLRDDGKVVAQDVPLAGSKPGVPSVAPDQSPDYLPLDALGVAPTPIGDEEFLPLNGLPPFVFGGVTYTSLAVSSNGYVKAGTATSEDQNCCNLPAGPSPARPNTIIAPFWTDLDGTGAPGIFFTVVESGSERWIVIEHRVHVFGTSSLRTFQTWIGANGTEDITMVYPPNDRPQDPGGQPFLVGAENALGQGEISPTLPTTDLRVTSSAPTPGASVSYSMTVAGRSRGAKAVTTTMTSPASPGTTTVVRAPVTVTRAGRG